MVCKKCGAKLKKGCLFCSECGQEVQIVPEYNILENDIIDSYIGEKQQTPKEKKEQVSAHKKTIPAKTIIVLFSTACIIGCVLLIILVNYGISIYENNHSFDYQYSQAVNYYDEGNYESAVAYVNKALELAPDNKEAMLLLADADIEEASYSEAEDLLNQLLERDSSDVDIYKLFIKLYKIKGEYNKIEKLSEGVTDTKILELLSEYIVSPPVLSKNTGKYLDDLLISITSSDNNKIFYTTDGTDPIENGKLYRNPISFSGEGDYQIRTVCKDANEVFSEETEATYHITYANPDNPVVSPESGTYEGEQLISIDVPEGCNAYYTWDGSMPDKTSPQYMEPLVMPEGENTLSVIYISKHGKISNMSQYNYVRT